MRKDLEPSEIIFVEEIATRYAAGDSLEKIHEDLGWPFARVKQLSSTEEFDSFLFRLSPERLEEWKETSAPAAGAARLKDLAKENKKDYLEILDQLARSATNENVRYNAVIALLKYAGDAEDAMLPTEIVEMPASTIDNFWQRWEESEPPH